MTAAAAAASASPAPRHVGSVSATFTATVPGSGQNGTRSTLGSFSFILQPKAAINFSTANFPTAFPASGTADSVATAFRISALTAQKKPL